MCPAGWTHGMHIPRCWSRRQSWVFTMLLSRECPWCWAPQEVWPHSALSLWLRRQFLKGNKSCFKADFPKNYMLFYSRKQPKEQRTAEDETSLPAPAAHSNVRRHLLAGEKGGIFCYEGTSAPVDILTLFSAEELLSPGFLRWLSNSGSFTLQ